MDEESTVIFFSPAWRWAQMAASNVAAVMRSFSASRS